MNKNVRKFVVLSIIFVLLYSGAGMFSNAYATPKESKDVGDSWTVIVYLCADNNLDGAGRSDLAEMESGLGLDFTGVNVVCLCDFWGVDDSYIWVASNNSFETLNVTEVNSSWGNELNMGDSRVLYDFCNWSINNFSADNYMLVLWNHGNSIVQMLDFTNSDGLYNDELKVLDSLNVTFSIILEDSCYEADIFVMYDFQNYCDYFIASETIIPLAGCPYDIMLSNLKANKTENGEFIARMIVEAYSEVYSHSKFQLGVWNLTGDGINNVTYALENFIVNATNSLSENINLFNFIWEGAVDCRGLMSSRFISGDDAKYYTDYRVSYPDVWAYDLCSFMNGFILHSYPDENVTFWANKTINAIEDIYVCGVHGSFFENAGGMSIYRPDSVVDYDAVYEQTDFARETNWTTFLLTVYNELGAMANMPTCEIISPSNGEIVFGVVMVSVEAFDPEATGGLTAFLRIDGGDWLGMTSVDGVWVYDLDTDSFSEGYHDVSAVAYNGINYSTVDSIYVVIRSGMLWEVRFTEEFDILRVFIQKSGDTYNVSVLTSWSEFGVNVSINNADLIRKDYPSTAYVVMEGRVDSLDDLYVEKNKDVAVRIKGGLDLDSLRVCDGVPVFYVSNLGDYSNYNYFYDNVSQEVRVIINEKNVSSFIVDLRDVDLFEEKISVGGWELWTKTFINVEIITDNNITVTYILPCQGKSVGGWLFNKITVEGWNDWWSSLMRLLGKGDEGFADVKEEDGCLYVVASKKILEVKW